MGEGFGAVADLLALPSTPKLDGANVSRAGSRVSGVPLALAGAVGGGGTTVAGNGAVPVPARGCARTGDGCAVAAVGLRTGDGGGPIAGEAAEGGWP